MGAAGTRAWSRGDIVWAANNAAIVIATGQIVVLIMYFQFILIPLTLAYFFCFLVSPVLNSLEFRPIILPGGKQLCLNTELDPDFPGDRRYKSQYRRSVSESCAPPSTLINRFLTLFGSLGACNSGNSFGWNLRFLDNLQTSTRPCSSGNDTNRRSFDRRAGFDPLV